MGFEPAPPTLARLFSTYCGRKETALGHVWTAPFWQGLIEGDAGWSVLSCVRPVDAAWVPLALMLPADRAPKS
jgi:hypothetical protein